MSLDTLYSLLGRIPEIWTKDLEKGDFECCGDGLLVERRDERNRRGKTQNPLCEYSEAIHYTGNRKPLWRSQNELAAPK